MKKKASATFILFFFSLAFIDLLENRLLQHVKGSLRWLAIYIKAIPPRTQLLTRPYILLKITKN